MTSCRCIKLETIPVGHTFWPVENCLYVVKLNLKSSNDDPLCRRCLASPSNRDAFAHELVATLSNQKMLANVTNFATVSVACPSRWSSSSKLHLFRPIPISFWHWGRVNLHFFKMKSKKKTCKSHHVGDSSICIEVAFYDLQIHHSFLNFWQWSTLSRTNVPEGIGSSGHPAHLNVAPERSQEQEHWVQDLDDGPFLKSKICNLKF